MNVSKETTKRELVEIHGVTEELVRREGINLSAGYVNAVEVCCNLFSTPTFDQLLDSFKTHLSQGSLSEMTV